MTSATSWSIALTVVAYTLVAPTAFAQDNPADAAFGEGRRLLAAGKIAAACEKFSQSQRLGPALGTLLNLADCHERQGRTATALEEFRQVAKLAEKQGKQEFNNEAKRRIDALRPKLTRLQLELPQRPSDVIVRHNGTDVTARIGKAFPVDPGRQRIEASAPGFASWNRDVELTEAGQTLRIEIALASEPEKEISTRERTDEVGDDERTDEPDDVDDVVDDDASAPTDPDKGRGRRLLGLGVGGAGLALAGTGLVFGALAKSAYDDRADDCRIGNLCTPEGLDTIDTAKSRATISTVLVSAGVVAVGAGVVLYLTAPKGDRRTAVAPMVGPDSVGLALVGTL